MRIKEHASLLLPGTYEQFLMNLRRTTRHNFRYYRRRFESAGHVYVEDLALDELRGAASYLDPKCRITNRRDTINRFLRMAAAADRPLSAGLKHKDGQWLSIMCGVYRPGAGMLLMQLNNDREFQRESLSVVLRGYLIESLIRQGIKKLDFWGRKNCYQARYRLFDANIHFGVYLDSPKFCGV